MNIILFASILVVSINQSFACECGDQLATNFYDKSKFEGKLSRFQWYTVVMSKGRDSCGAALIDDQHVATSAHCVNGLKAKAIKVQLNDKSNRTISSVWVDSRYNVTNRAYDFAILTLSKPVNSQFKPLCMQNKYPEFETLYVRVNPRVDGSSETYPIAIENARCSLPASETHVCGFSFDDANDEVNDGPFAAYEVNKKYYFVGVVSRAGTRNKFLYTDATKYVDTIKKLAPKSCWKDKNGQV